jgi:hypothetical protein
MFIDGHHVCSFDCAELHAHARGRVIVHESVARKEDLFATSMVHHLASERPRHKPEEKKAPVDRLWEEEIFPALERAFRAELERKKTKKTDT